MSGIFKDNRRKATQDTWTGKVYPARNKCYQDLALSLGMNIVNSLGWYDICKKFPGRFKDVATGRKIDANGRLI